MAGTKPRRLPRGFFVAVHPVAMTLTLAFLYLMTMAWVWPDGVSTKMFGQISDLVNYIGTNYNKQMEIAVIATGVAHAVEGLVALIMCYRHNLKKTVTLLWFIQTLIFGFFSLRYLLWPQYIIFTVHAD